MGDREAKAASSKTYTKVVKELSAALGKKPDYSGTPSEAFKRLLRNVRDLKRKQDAQDVLKALHAALGEALGKRKRRLKKAR